MSELPPGQRRAAKFRRFGLPNFAFYRARKGQSWQLEIAGQVDESGDIYPQLGQLPRVRQRSDFHCLTTWSYPGLEWEGYRFADVYRELIEPRLSEGVRPAIVVFRGDDHYVTSLPLSDALAEDVMLADRLGGEPLDFDHGAPLRLVAPAHYGYKNVKHLCRIELAESDKVYRFSRPWPRLMEHPRGRVALEERGRFFRARTFRLLYRPLIWPMWLLFGWVNRR